jgi:hypothetical protein
VLGEGDLLYEEEVALQPGANNFVVRLQAGDPGFNRYRVQLSPVSGADTFPQNNELAAFTEVTGPPRVLMVSAENDAEDAPNETIQLRAALEASGLHWWIKPRRPPYHPAWQTLNDYASIILVNLNARDLNQRKMETLQSYVRDLGGGLVAIGGPESLRHGRLLRHAAGRDLTGGHAN